MLWASSIVSSRSTPISGALNGEGTAELARTQAGHYGVRFISVTRAAGDLLAQVEARGMWPSSKARFCTSDHKRDQIARVMTQLTDELRGQVGERPVRILNAMGVRAQESPARARKTPFERDNRASNGRREVDRWYPIFRWTVDDVWARIRASGVSYHPVYDAGLPRLSCALCILAPKAALKRAILLAPELADEYVALEARIGHRFQAKSSIAEYVAEARADANALSSPIEEWAV